MLETLTFLQEESRNLVGHKLSKIIFEEFLNPNNRLIIAVSCLRAGYKDVAFRLFTSIMEEGPKENKDYHFAYVRSLVELAELEAESGNFIEAEQHMSRALGVFPMNMSYMMSRVHLEVYHAYYCFQADLKAIAYKKIDAICQKEQERFKSIGSDDAMQLVGPGLCYALHQWALFYAEEGNWDLAVSKLKEVFQYMTYIDQEVVSQGRRHEEQGNLEHAFYRYEEMIDERRN